MNGSGVPIHFFQDHLSDLLFFLQLAHVSVQLISHAIEPWHDPCFDAETSHFDMKQLFPLARG